MDYIINGVVKFNSSDGTLFCLDSSMDMLTLTRVSSELLLLLIKSNGTSISRDAILNELWEKRGLSASSNNLNNYVSMLRKALAQVGCPDLITTIPKYGFLFEAEITTFADDEENESRVHEHINPSTETDTTLPDRINNTFSHSLRPLSTRRKISMGLLLSALATLYLPGLYHYLTLRSIRTEIFKVDQCRLYILGDTSKIMDRANVIEKTKDIIHHYELNCKTPVTLYYSVIDRPKMAGREFFNQTVSYCPDNNHIQCENYYLSDKVKSNAH